MYSSILKSLFCLMAIVCATLVLGSVTAVFSQSGGPFVVQQSVVAAGGNISTGGNFQLVGTAGQAAAGTTMSGGAFTQVGGFWQANLNAAPTAISLSANTVSEGLVAGTTVGTLSTADPDAGNTFIYSLVSGAGGDDNPSFTIDSNQLRTAAVFDFESKSNYSVRVRSQDQGGLFFEQQLTILVANVNEAPTVIALAPNSVAEASIAGTTVGTLATLDPDAGNSFTYTLVNGAGGNDNGSFTINGNQIRTAAVFDFESRSSYQIRLRSQDQGGLFFDQQLTILVTNVNEAPTAIALSANSVAEASAAGTTVGILSTVDPDAGNTFTYTLVNGAGSDDNGSFTIDGKQVRTAAVFDFESKSSYQIRVRTLDQDGQSVEKQLTITVTNLNEAPTNISLSQTNVQPNTPAGATVGTFSSTDPDAGNTFNYALVSGEGSADNDSFRTNGNELKIAAVPNRPTYNIRVRTTDQDGLSFEKPFTISAAAGGGILQFSSAAYSVGENEGPATITITRTGGSAGIATVLFATSNGTAGATDYTSVSQTLTFSDGETSKTVNIPIADDSTSEPDETINLTLSQVSGTGNAGTPLTALLTVYDDDAPGAIISFSQANYSVAETGPGFIDITVTRSGDTSRPVSVNYATPDDSDSPIAVPCATTNGVATSRCDFTTALGTLKFAAGETTRTFTVLISQDNYVEGPETLALKLSNLTGGAVLGTPATAVLTITDDAAEPATSPADDPANYVRQHYHDFLNREPDSAGLAFWTNQITDCTPVPQCLEVRRINVSAAFFLSIEFQETGYLVERFYKAAYGDAIGTSTLGGVHQLAVPIVRVDEFLPDTQQMGQGVVVGQNGWQAMLESNKQAYAADFVSRARFTSAFPASLTAAQFVDQLNTNAGNPLSSSERDQLVNDLSTGARTRAQVLRQVAEDPDLKNAEFNRAFVLMQYFGYLRRHPNSAPDGDYTGHDFWFTKLNQFNGNYIDAEMVRAFIESIEYRQRFGH
jgi:hypothetical protein